MLYFLMINTKNKYIIHNKFLKHILGPPGTPGNQGNPGSPGMVVSFLKYIYLFYLIT